MGSGRDLGSSVRPRPPPERQLEDAAEMPTDEEVPEALAPSSLEKDSLLALLSAASTLR